MTGSPSHAPLVVYVDMYDTLVRSVGTKRMQIPAVGAHVRAPKEAGAVVYCWISGDAEHARTSANEVGLAECFTAFLPKS